MRFALILVSVLCAPLVRADAAADSKCLGTCLQNVVASGNQTQEVLNCVASSNDGEEQTKCFCNSEPLIDQLTACVKSNCGSGAFDSVQKACDKVGGQVPENAAVSSGRISLTVLIAAGIAVLTTT